MPYPSAERIKVVGKLDPDCLYTREGCMRYAGLGRRALEDARASKIVRPRLMSGRLYYDGAELIEWIKSSKANS